MYKIGMVNEIYDNKNGIKKISINSKYEKYDILYSNNSKTGCIIDIKGETIKLSYNTNGYITTISKLDKNKNKYRYIARNRYRYNEYNRIKTVSNIYEKIEFTYDDNNRLIRTTNNKDIVVDFKYIDDIIIKMVKTKYKEYIVQYLVKNNKIIEELYHTGSIFYYTKYDYCDNICKITHYSNSDVNSIPDDMIYNITISTDRNINKLML